MRRLSPAVSAAKAVADHLHALHFGTAEVSCSTLSLNRTLSLVLMCFCCRSCPSPLCQGEFVNMGVLTNGNPYGIPDNLMCSLPVRIKNHKWEIVEVCAFAPAVIRESAFHRLLSLYPPASHTHAHTQDLKLSDETRTALMHAAEELTAERELGMQVCGTANGGEQKGAWRSPPSSIPPPPNASSTPILHFTPFIGSRVMRLKTAAQAPPPPLQHPWTNLDVSSHL